VVIVVVVVVVVIVIVVAVFVVVVAAVIIVDIVDILGFSLNTSNERATFGVFSEFGNNCLLPFCLFRPERASKIFLRWSKIPGAWN